MHAADGPSRHICQNPPSGNYPSASIRFRSFLPRDGKKGLEVSKYSFVHGEPKRAHKAKKGARTAPKDSSQQLEGVIGHYPSTTRVFKHIAPEVSAKSPSHSFFVVRFLSPNRVRFQVVKVLIFGGFPLGNPTIGVCVCVCVCARLLVCLEEGKRPSANGKRHRTVMQKAHKNLFPPASPPI